MYSKRSIYISLAVYNLIEFLLFQKTRHGEAERWFSKAKQLAPSDPSVYLHYGLFLMDAEGDRNFEAGQKFQMASELILGNNKDLNPNKSPDNIEESALHSSISVYDSVFNAAVAYRQAGRHDLAEIFYRKAVTIRPKVLLICMGETNIHTNISHSM